RVRDHRRDAAGPAGHGGGGPRRAGAAAARLGAQRRLERRLERRLQWRRRWRMRAAVLGSGSWGTVFAKVLGDAGTEVVMWARRPQIAVAIRERRHNPDYLPGARLPDPVTATGDAAAALDGAELVVLAVPSQTLRANLAEWRRLIDPDATPVSLIQGIELATSKRMSE